MNFSAGPSDESHEAAGRVGVVRAERAAGDGYGTGMAERWRDNQGNLILIVTAGIFLAGSIVLVYRQTRFRAPAFPDARSLQAMAALNDNDGNAVDPMGQAARPENDSELRSDESHPNAIEIRVLGATADGGQVRVAVYADESSFNDVEQAVLKRTLPVNADGNAATWVDVALLPRTFAVAAYHDRNDDGQLNRNALKMPTERYGFSNEARGTLGPPEYASAEIERPAPGGSIDISIR